MSATKLQLNQSEVEILKKFLNCNPCEAGCILELPSKVDCDHCKLMQVKHKLLTALGDYGRYWIDKSVSDHSPKQFFDDCVSILHSRSNDIQKPREKDQK